MTATGYSFSLRGSSHKNNNISCQDYASTFEVFNCNGYVVADGVSNCSMSHIAAEIAGKAAEFFICSAFPYGKNRDFPALLKSAFDAAANAVDKFALDQGDDPNNYHTTLCLALCTGSEVYYANTGDSGIIVLDEYGNYHQITTPQNDEFGAVYPLAARDFQIGKLDEIKPAAVIVATDGLLNWIAPKSLEKYKYPVFVPRADILVPSTLFERDREDITEDTMDKLCENAKSILEKLVTKVENRELYDENYGNLLEGNLFDDLSAAVYINTDTLLESSDIKWKVPKHTVEEEYGDIYRYYRNLYPSYADKMLVDLVVETAKCNREMAERFLKKLKRDYSSDEKDENDEKDTSKDTSAD